MQSLFEKLQLQDERNLLIQGLPSSIEKQFAKLSYAKNVTPLLRNKKIDFALIFAVNTAQLCSILHDVFTAVHEKTKLWIAYPKITSKISSDLNRDCSWKNLYENEYEPADEIAIDHVWTAIRFQRAELVLEEAGFAEAVEKPTVLAFDNKAVKAPTELESFFVTHKKAKDFFKSLSFNNQKEYVMWIEDAKKHETKQRRLATVCKKLLAGKKNPTEK